MVKRQKLKAFTLVEVLTATFLSGIVAAFVYIMITASYEYFNRLNSVSRFSNNLRFLTNSLRLSVTNAFYINVISSNKLVFERQDDYNKDDASDSLDLVREEYIFPDGAARFKNSLQYSITVDTTTAPFNATRGMLYKDTYVDGVFKSRILMANNIRTIFYTISSNKLNLGLVYDEVIDGKVLDDGTVTSKDNGMTSFVTEGKSLCFTSRSIE